MPSTGFNPPVGNNPDITAAQITVVQTIDATDNNAKFSDVGSKFFTDYMVESKYEFDYRRYLMGVTAEQGFAGNSAAIVQLASPTLLLIVNWTAASADEMPSIPNPNLNNQKWILLDQHLEPAPVSSLPDGETAIYRISGVIVLANLNPDMQNPLGDVTFPKMPWIQDGFARTLSQSMYDSSILENTGGSAGQGGGQGMGGQVGPGSLVPNTTTPSNIKARNLFS